MEVMTQDEALNILKTGANVFLTGEPGSGKTHTVNRYVSWLREHEIEPSITASTGIAATHIGGYTIHSWSGIGIRRELSAYDLDRIANNKRVFGRVNNACILIIDEVSMLSARALAMVEAVCREIRRNGEPFGGLQIVLVGDFFQLPPVSQREDNTPQESFFPDSSGTPFAFTAPIWDALNLLVCYLSEQHRQEDAGFLDFLSAVRRADVSAAHRALLRTRYAPRPQDGLTQLYSHNADVDAINDRELSKLSGDKETFMMRSRGPENLVAALMRGCLSPEVLALKIGARVMFTKNDTLTHRFVNGTLGVVADFAEETGYPIVTTRSGRNIVAEPMDWNLEDNGKVLACISQVPLRLAWAMTVHKSQGLSLDAAHMDLSHTFEYGQGYVALSRVRTFKGLSLAGLNQRALQVHPDILSKDASFREHAERTRDAFGKMGAEELQVMHENFIRACGGSVKKVRVEKKKAEKIATIEVTLALLKSGKSIEEIARERMLAPTTIFSHLCKLFVKNRIGPADIELLVSPDLKQALPAIHAVFKEVGSELLKPIYEKLEGSYSYEDLHLARMLYSE